MLLMPNHESQNVFGRQRYSVSIGALDNCSGKSMHECRAVIVPDEDGGYCAFARRLPGVVSQGDTVDEAFTNVCEAFAATLETYRELKMEIPWEQIALDHGKTSQERWAMVHVG